MAAPARGRTAAAARVRMLGRLTARPPYSVAFLGSWSRRSVAELLLVGLAVLGAAGLRLVPGVLGDLGRIVLIAVGAVFDELLLGELEPLGLPAAGLLDGLALFAAALVEVEQWVGGVLAGHREHDTRSR